MRWSVLVTWRDNSEEYVDITEYRMSPNSGEPLMLLVDVNKTVIYLRNWESIVVTREVDHGTDTLL